MSYILTLEELNLTINRLVIPFLDTYNLREIEEPIKDLDNINEELYLRAILLIKQFLNEELPFYYERLFKELFIISTLEEIKYNYINFYKDNKGTLSLLIEDYY
jgi:hypothetical protein